MKFKTEPFQHQIDSLELAKDKPYWAHFHEMGAGKTKIVIDNANYLYLHDKIDSVLVVAPNGVHRNWAEREIKKHSAAASNIYCWDGKPTSMKAKRKLELFFKNAEHGTKALHAIHWLCMNIEAVRTPAGYEVAEKFLRKNWTMMVVDESTVIKTPKAKQTKATIFLGTLAAYRRILTGTPITQGPLDLYSQCKFLARESIPYTSFTAFKNTFAEEREIMLNSGKRFRQVTGYKQLDYLKSLVEVFSDRILKSECLDLPDKLYQELIVPMHKKQQEVYSSMRDLYVARLEEQEKTTGFVTAQNALTLLQKLQQIATGFLIDDEGLTHPLPNNRIEKLVDLCQSITTKALVWCAYRQNIFDVSERLRDEFGEQSVVTYFGDTTQQGRSDAINRFQNDPECRFFISNKTGSEGITLTEAEYSIYFSNTYSLHTRLQSEDRNHRIGQSRNVTYIDMYCPGTVDERIMQALKNKKEIADTVLENWRELLLL